RGQPGRLLRQLARRRGERDLREPPVPRRHSAVEYLRILVASLWLTTSIGILLGPLATPAASPRLTAGMRFPSGTRRAVAMELRYPIVDADAHVSEQGNATYRPYLPAEYRERTGSFFPQFAWDIRVDGTLGKLDVCDPRTYLEDMDAEHIATQVLY